MSKNNKAVQDSCQTMPVLPLRDIVVFPHMMVPLFIGRDISIKALDAAMEGKTQVLLVAQKIADEEQPLAENLYQIGTIINVVQLLKLPDGAVKVLVEGVGRGTIKQFVNTKNYFLAEVIQEQEIESSPSESSILKRTVKSQFDQYVKLGRKIPSELIASVLSIDESSNLTDVIAAHITLKIEDKQDLLATFDITKRLKSLIVLLEKEIDYLQIEKKIRTRVKRQMEKTQREYYLSEQKRAIEKELGEMDAASNDIDKIITRIKDAKMPQDVYEKCMSEVNKLKNMSPISAEATVSRNYLDWILSLPWYYDKPLKINLKQAEAVLEAEHFGLKEVKERILEYLAVQKRTKKIKGPVLCLVGPPGVGKTSLARSIANATGRKFLRISLGGVKDEAEIRGHRRTYIGAMPGKIIQKMAKATDKRALCLIDEIDKIGMDYRGDPAAALLEVFDPEQNYAFNDHYLEVDYDLSEVMFVATANTLDIPHALRDRLEVIRISGYTEDEKLHIATKHLIPKQLAANGLMPLEIELPSPVIKEIIRYYTRESGMRNLDREIAKICRKVVRNLASKRKVALPVTIKIDDLATYLGPKKFSSTITIKSNSIGQVKGLAWTEMGGEMLEIEAVTVPGKGKLVYTGQLGNVMKESIQAAFTVIKARAPLLGVETNYFDKNDFHIHVPEGATPKDGPSAGITMCVALASVILQLSVRSDLAMTGEITLRGEVLLIGGVKEKLLAAHRFGIKNIIIPAGNVKDLQNVPENIKKDLLIKPVEWIDEVLNEAIPGYAEKLAQHRANIEQGSQQKLTGKKIQKQLSAQSINL